MKILIILYIYMLQTHFIYFIIRVDEDAIKLCREMTCNIKACEKELHAVHPRRAGWQ